MMKKALLVGFVAGSALIASAIAFAAPKVGSTAYVRVISGKIQKSPKFIAPSAGTLSRGDAVTLKEIRGDWYLIDGRGGSGWIHKSTVQDKVVNLTSAEGTSRGGASQSEVELAGRGFTPEVEKEYRGSHPDLDFSHVDAIEKAELDSEELIRFAESGGVGGAP